METLPRSTWDDVGSHARSTPVAILRNAAIAVLLVITILGALGLLGVRSATITASQAGYDAELTYPQIARAGLDVPWELTLTRTDGFDEPITLAIDMAYLELFEIRNRIPETSTETAGDGTAYLTFEPPPGDTFTLELDLGVQGGAQWGKSGSVSVLEGRTAVLTIDFTTWLVP